MADDTNPNDAIQPDAVDGPADLFAQVMNLQHDMQSAQAEIAATTVTGSAGGGLVTVELRGAGNEVVRVTIAPDAAEDLEELEDLVLAAVNDALRRSAELTHERLAGLTGGFDLGALFGGDS